MRKNPFHPEYIAQELAFWGTPPAVCRDGAFELRYRQIHGRCDDYLNKAFILDGPTVPVLYLNTQLWVSLAPMELRSMAVALQLARDRVATTGLGLGYFARRAAAKREVQHVTVYEHNALVIEWFSQTFHQCPEFKKISIVHGDVYDTFHGQAYDLAFMDHYQTMLSDAVITDIKHFTTANTIQHYRFWGQERVFLDAIAAHHLPCRGLTSADRRLFQRWTAWRESFDGSAYRPSQLYQPVAGAEFCAKVLAALP